MYFEDVKDFAKECAVALDCTDFFCEGDYVEFRLTTYDEQSFKETVAKIEKKYLSREIEIKRIYTYEDEDGYEVTVWLN